MKKWWFCLLSALLFQPFSADALGLQNLPLRDVLAHAEVICRGKVLAVHKGEEDTVSFSRGWLEDKYYSTGPLPVISMSADFAVERVLKGKLASKNVKIQYWHDNRKQVIGNGGLLSLAAGEDCYLFLKETLLENVFWPATPFATSKQSLSDRLGQSFVFEGEGPWPGADKVEISMFGKKVLIPEATIRAFQKEYAEALQVENPTEVTFEIMRATSITVIGLSRNRSCLSFLTKVLKNDPSPLVRRQAAYALKAQRGPVETIYALIRALRRDPDPDCRRTAAEVLGAFEGITAASALAKAIRKDADPAVRLGALKTLKWVIHRSEHADVKEHVKFIKDAMLNDPDEKIRLEAAEAMKELGAL